MPWKSWPSWGELSCCCCCSYEISIEKQEDRKESADKTEEAEEDKKRDRDDHFNFTLKSLKQNFLAIVEENWLVRWISDHCESNKIVIKPSKLVRSENFVLNEEKRESSIFVKTCPEKKNWRVLEIGLTEIEIWKQNWQRLRCQYWYQYWYWYRESASTSSKGNRLLFAAHKNRIRPFN